MARTLGSMLRRARVKWPRRHTMHPTPTCAGILRRLRALGVEIPGPDASWRVNRTRSGHHQRSAGAWSWSLEWAGAEEGRHNGFTGQVGSQFPARDCMRPGARVSQDGFGRVTMWPPGVA